MIMELVKLSDKTIEAIENNGFSLEEITKQDGKYYVEMNQNTPEGEDWWETVRFDGTDEGFAETIMDRANNFDIDEEAEIWIDGRGKNGVPNSIKDLVVDAEWKQEKLENLAKELNKEEVIYI